MRRLIIVTGIGLGLALPSPAVSQVALLFPHGIASGDVRDRSAVLWTRPSRATPVTAEISTDPGFGVLAFRRTVTPSPDRDLTVKVQATRLDPGTRYHYRFRAGRGAFSATGTFVTAPAADAGAGVSFAFSGDSDGTHVRGAPGLSFAVLDGVAAERPDFFVYLGDTIYADSGLAPSPASTLEGYRARYREARSIRELRDLMSATSVIATWDDHEVENDFDRETVDPARFAAGLRAFQEYMPLAEQRGGRLYRKFRWGRDAEMFVLDGRSYRSRQVSKTPACDNPPGSRMADLAPALPAPIRAAFAPLIRQMALPVPPGCLAAIYDPGRTMLGEAQKYWLMRELARSDATWKLIVNQTPVQEFFANPYDRWEGYAAERIEILTVVRASNIRNVVWLSSDTHATLVNDVRIDTFTPPFDVTGMKEVVGGPIAATLFAQSVAAVAGPAVVPALVAFLTARAPRGVGMSCAVLDRYAYVKVDVDSGARRLTITPKDAAGRPVCPAPLVLTATP